MRRSLICLVANSPKNTSFLCGLSRTIVVVFALHVMQQLDVRLHNGRIMSKACTL
jgi:hypothetical protein